MNPNLNLQDQIVRDRQQQLRAEAEDWRLLNEGSEEVIEAKPAYGPLLARAGAILSEIGDQLQDRYGQAMDVTPVDRNTIGRSPLLIKKGRGEVATSFLILDLAIHRIGHLHLGRHGELSRFNRCTTAH